MSKKVGEDELFWFETRYNSSSAEQREQAYKALGDRIGQILMKLPKGLYSLRFSEEKTRDLKGVTTAHADVWIYPMPSKDE